MDARRGLLKAAAICFLAALLLAVRALSADAAPATGGGCTYYEGRARVTAITPGRLCDAVTLDFLDWTFSRRVRHASLRLGDSVRLAAWACDGRLILRQWGG